MNRLSTISRSLIVASCAFGALIGFTSLASASPPDRTPESGDDRATAHAGNVNGQDCSSLFPGSTAVAQGDVQFEGGDNTAGLDITSVPEGIEIVGVIVKGGPAYNVYAGLGDLPWLDLHAPLVPSGEPAAVSHWFVCGVEEKDDTSTPPTTTPSEGEGSGGGGSTESPESSAPQGDVSPAAEEEELAATGVASGPLVALGAMLLLGGGALLLLTRMRGARR
jgi:hypothetical protein